MSTRTTFNEAKATQLAALFLSKACEPMPYLLLIKLMYLTDRAAILKWGSPATNDDYFSMRLGPVLSNVLDLVTVDGDVPEQGGYWASHISAPSEYRVAATAPVSFDALLDEEIALANEVFAEYEHVDRFALVELLHQKLREWKRLDSGRHPIRIEDILRADNRSDAEIADILEDNSTIDFANNIAAVR